MPSNNNPFEPPSSASNGVHTLRQAFPNVDPEIIDDVLLSVNGNVQDAFECVLHMTDPQSVAGGSTIKELPPIPPPVPHRRESRSCRSNPPFLNGSRTTTRARQDLAQWRQQLSEESRQRRQDESREHWRTSFGTARSDTPSFSSTIPQHWKSKSLFFCFPAFVAICFVNGKLKPIKQKLDYSNDRGTTIGHLIEAAGNEYAAAIKKANTYYNQTVVNATAATAAAVTAAADPSTYLSPNGRSRGSSCSFNTQQRCRSDSALGSNTATTTRRTAAATPTTTTTAAPVRSATPTPPSTTRTIPGDRNRPLPTPPQQSASSSSVNPFDPMITANDELPPPSYEAHVRDKYVEPHDVDRIIQANAQPSRSL
ncbi:hypothetical protein BDB00DRAFT_456009 [Zychaea mexicana]|uniref:uncharacterized protein n=1 Tax=Zychaea mexicana TaxID=64656 RepID=UPI0022FE457E|nr:uncharacterized protein BDB00DRAFT_456009 [Zychaea mexicana]KAI9492187.1 hypothetical protein BDB00DRAFT_456009 [Zychaea mexicana]